MKIIQCNQGTPEWFEVRCGLPTCSNFDKIVTTKGLPSKQKEKYLWKVAGEAITRVPEETYQNFAMARGIELESEARIFYELTTGLTVEQVGFCTTDDGKVGCSPDGLVGNEGMIEVKCPTIAVHVGYLLANSVPSDYFQQLQGQLYVTGRKWVDFMSYSVGLKPLIVRIYPDEEFQIRLKEELEKFCKELKEVICLIKI